MATARDILNRAMRRLRVIGIEEEMEAAQARDALALMNAMMHGWRSRGVDIEHTNYELGTETALGDEWDLALEYLVAEHIGPTYNRQLSSAESMEKRRWWRNLKAEYTTATASALDKTLQRLDVNKEAVYGVGLDA